MKKILAIDDQRDNLVSIKGFLRNFLPDCKLYLAQSGKEGIAIALKEQPDTILLDIIMPEMDGFEVCKILKQDERTKFIPILFLSALGQDQESRVKGLELGADAFLSKPFIPTELKAQINVMLRIKEAEDKLREEKDVLEVAVSKKIIELKQSEETYRTLLNNLNSAVVVHSPDTSVKYANPTACRLLGLSEDQLKGKKAIDPQWKFLRDDHSDMPLEEFPVNQVLSMNEPLRNFVVGVKRSKNKDIVWALVNGYSLLDDSGKIVEVIINFIDISERKQAGEDLKESERRISTLINNLQGIAYRCNNDEDWTMEFISAGIEEITGYAPEDIIDNKKFSFNDIIIPEDRDRIWKVIRSAIGKKELFEINYQIKTASGETKYLSEKGTGIFDEHDGKLIALEGFINDVTEQVIANKAIQASEERNRSITETAADAIISINDDGIILSWNAAAEKIFGFSSKEMVNNNLSKVIPKNFIKGHVSGLKRLIEVGKEKLMGGTIEIIAIRKDGTEFPIELSLSSWETDNRKYFTGIIRDITERKLTEDLISDQKEALSGIIKGTNAGTWDWNILTGELKLNDRWAEIMGYSLKELEPIDVNTWEKNVHPDDLPATYAIIDKVFNKELDYYDVVFRQPHKNGGWVWVNARGKVVEWTDDGKPVRLSGTHTDITKRKEAEKEIIQSEKRFKRLFDGLGDAVFVTKVGGKNKGQILEVNSAAISQTGYNREELLRMNIIKDLYVVNSGEISPEIWEERLNKGETVTVTEKKKKKDGTDYWTEIIVTQIDFKGEKASLSINHDITNRKRTEQIQKVLYNISNTVIAEDNLEKLIGFIRNELGTIIDTSNFYVALYDQDTDTLSLPFLVDETETRTNIPAGKTLTYYVIKTQKSLLANKKRIKELEDSGDIGKFGAESEVWLGVPLKIEDKVKGVLAVQSYTNEMEYDKADMEMLEFVTEQISISIMRKKAEEDLKNALKKATESDRLKSAFLATISHELRTPLNAIVGFSDLINKDWPIDEIIGFAKTINQSGAHLLSIVEEIFDITLIESGETTVNYKRENLHITLNNIHKTIKSQQRILNKEGIELRMVIPENDAGLIINTDIAKLKQILLNLLKNALKFTHTGHINFGYSFIENGEKKMLRFYVEDTGIGVPVDKQEMIFTTFRQVEESLSKTYGGTGIGLSISKKLTELLGGRIWIESTFGKGSTFYFTIPVEMPETDNQQYQIGFVDEATTVSRKPKSANEKIFLIVEDDETSFEFLQIVLEKPGTTIIWAKNGEEAVEYCKNVNDVTLVLMDINMDVMDGYDATKEIKKMHPDLPIIAQTANAIAGDREKTIKAGCDDYISKPINIEDLMDKIEKLI